jgi:hypothetical protein
VGPETQQKSCKEDVEECSYAGNERLKNKHPSCVREQKVCVPTRSANHVPRALPVKSPSKPRLP